ncbi:MAG: putative toxin-antitoxin system toxin component, PIN family, partial [Candidatus Methylophosphatis roskildensis]
TPHHLLSTIREHASIQLYSSAALLDELADVLTRPSATKRLALIGKTVREVLADYLEAVELVEPTDVPRVVPNDPDDDQVIAAALTAGADWIVSGDVDLLSLRHHRGIPIVNSAQALQQIAK